MNERYDPVWAARFFDDYGEREWERLTASPAAEVKLHVHRHYLEKYVAGGSRVLEIGAGAGRFTEILAGLGATVVVADISSVQLDLNRKHALELGFESAVESRLKIDICDMSALESKPFDAVVCYGGPLSYVFDNAGAAAAEMFRVLKDGGVLLASVMGLWGSVHEYLQGVTALPVEVNRLIIESGDLCPETYPESEHHCHMFRAREFQSLLEASGADVLDMSASNCLSAAWGDRLTDIRADAGNWEQVLAMEVEACREPGCLDMGTHIIAVARKPG